MALIIGYLKKKKMEWGKRFLIGFYQQLNIAQKWFWHGNSHMNQALKKIKLKVVKIFMYETLKMETKQNNKKKWKPARLGVGGGC